MPYPLLTGTVRTSQGVSTPDVPGQTARVAFTRETFRSPVLVSARVTDAVAFGPVLSPAGGGGTVAPPPPTTGQLWPRGTP